MAARMRKTHQDDVRTKIQASQLINVLQNHALGISEELSPSRIKAIEVLLRKSLPDLQSVEHTGPDGGAVDMSWNISFSAPKQDDAKP